VTQEPRRRTQAERSAETTEALLDATIEAIAELGFHGATTAEICARAGVTHGALFHHFDTRIDLVLAALGRMTQRRIASYVEFADQVRAAGQPIDLLRMVWRLARDEVAVVWAELTIAARTDPELRARVQPALEARWALIRGAAEAFPALAMMEPRRRDVWLQLMRGTIELAPVLEPVLGDGDGDEGGAPVGDEARNRALLALAEHLGARFPAG
jgi:AcrR family transcriptional regulator